MQLDIAGRSSQMDDFAAAIHRTLATHAAPGSVVRLTDERGNFQGRAFYSDKSQISIRLLTREDVPIDRGFFTARLG